MTANITTATSAPLLRLSPSSASCHWSVKPAHSITLSTISSSSPDAMKVPLGALRWSASCGERSPEPAGRGVQAPVDSPANGFVSRGRANQGQESLARESDLPTLACDRAACQLRPLVVVNAPPVQPSLFHMPFAPEVQQLIQQVEQLSNRPVHVMEVVVVRGTPTTNACASLPSETFTVA